MKQLTLQLICTASLFVLNGPMDTYAQTHAARNGTSKTHAADNPKGSAVDLNKVRHTLDDQHDGKATWMEDETKSVRPFYPLEARAHKHQGSGLARLILNPATGAVTAAGMVKSTGYRELDDAALASFRQCVWKPGKWIEVDLPITFRLYNDDNSPIDSPIQ